MSWEASYDSANSAVPNVVTDWKSVEAPTGKAGTINNPNISQLGTLDYQQVQPIFKSKVSGNSLVPFTAQDQAAWDAKLAADLLASHVRCS